MTAGEWKQVTLEDVSTIRTGIAKGKPIRDGNAVAVPYLRVANVQDGHVDLGELKTLEVARDALARYSLQSGDVLFTEGGDYDKLGRGCVWRAQVEPCLHQNHVFAVRTDAQRLFPDYLSYYAASPIGKAYFLECAKQTTNLASINSTQLRAFPIPLPPLPEQRKIVAILSSVDDAIESTEAVIDQLQVLKRAMMAELLTRGIPGRHTKFKMTEIGELPEGWGVARVRSLAADLPNAITAGPFGTIFKAKDFRNNGIPIIQLRHVTERGFRWGNRTTFMDLAVYRSLHESFATRPGDVLVTKLGDPPGLAAIYPDGEPLAMVTPDVIKVTFDPNKMLPSFAVQMYNAAPTRRRLVPKTIGGTRPRMALETFYDLELPHPPRDEQQEIAAILGNLDERATQERANILGLQNVRSALMLVLLTGEVRVQPDEDAA